MKNQALQRRREEATARILPLISPPIPHAETRETAKDLDVDNRFAAYQVELDDLRRQQQEAAGEIRSRFDGVDQLIDIANRKIGGMKPDVIRLKATANVHHQAIAYNARITTAHSRTIEELHAEVADNFLLAATQEGLEELGTRLEKRLDEIDLKGTTASYIGYGTLAREIATLRHQFERLKSQPSRVVEGPKPDRLVTACAWIAGFAVVAGLFTRFILF